jgi:hypothetical protein
MNQNHLEEMQQDLDRQEASICNQMRHRAQSLIDDLERLIQQVDNAEAGLAHCINPLGILQGNGDDLDRMCGEFGKIREFKAMVDYIGRGGE